MTEDLNAPLSTTEDSQSKSFDIRVALSVVTGCVIVKPFSPVADLIEHLTGVSIKHPVHENQYDLLKFMKLQEPCRQVLIEKFPKLESLEKDFDANCKPSLGSNIERAHAKINLWLYKNNLGKQEAARLNIPALMAKDMVPERCDSGLQLFKTIKNER